MTISKDELITNDTELNNLLSESDKVNVLKYINEYLDKKNYYANISSDDLTHKLSCFNKSDNMFKSIFFKLVFSFAEEINTYLSENKYTDIRPLISVEGNIYFISTNHVLFKYNFSINQMQNMIHFLTLKSYIKQKAIEKSAEIDKMRENTLQLIEDTKKKIIKSTLFKDKPYITFDLIKQNDVSYQLVLRYKYIIMNHRIDFNIGKDISVATKYRKIQSSLQDDFVEGILTSPNRISDKDADVFIRLCKAYVPYNSEVIEHRFNNIKDNKTFTPHKLNELGALLLLSKLKGNE